MQSTADAYKLNTLSIAIDVLNYVAGHPRLTMSQIAEGCGINLGQANRVLSTLVMKRMLIRSADKRYTLGYAALHLGQQAGIHFPLRRTAAPILDELRRVTGESAHLVIRDGDGCVIVDVRESHQSVRVVSPIGKHGYLHVGGSGKVFLAYSSPAYIDRYLSQPLHVEGPSTITDPAVLRAELQRVVERGYCVALEDYEPDAFSVAAPVYDPQGEIVACIAVGGPLARWTTQQCDLYVEACLAAAKQLTNELIPAY